MDAERTDTVVVGGGQAGLALSYHLGRRGVPHVVLDSRPRVGDAWRGRWDSLRLFTPAYLDALPGSRYPGPAWSFPTAVELADHLEAYAVEHDLPVRTGVRVQRVRHDCTAYVVETAAGTLVCDNVVVASGFDALPRIPAFAEGLDPRIHQVHAAAYRRPDQLPPGDVLVVGAGNSGADIALDIAPHRVTYLSGRHPGQIPVRIGSRWARPVNRLVFLAFRHLLTVRTPLGRRARTEALAHSGPLIRVRLSDLDAAGVRRVPRTEGTEGGLPVLADGRVLDVASVVWCTGFDPDDGWVDPPLAAPGQQPDQDHGAVKDRPGLYVLGRLFQDSLASSMIHGVGHDADAVARHIAGRRSGAQPAVRRTISRAR